MMGRTGFAPARKRSTQSRTRRWWPGLVLAFLLLLNPVIARAQTEQPDRPVYIVQEGDTLWDIAQRFGVALEDLEGANDISDPGQIKAGMELAIPGLEGVQGVLVTREVPFGESLRSLSREVQVPPDMLVRLNHLTSPNELFSGVNLVLPESSAAAAPGQRVALAAGQSLLEAAAAHGANPWAVVRRNGLQGIWDGLPGDVLRLPGGSQDDGPGALPGEIASITIDPLPLVQGGTTVVKLKTTGEVSLTGSLIDHELHFFQDKKNTYVALQGVHALVQPGLYPLAIRATLPGGVPFAFSQLVEVTQGDFYYETLEVNPETIDPANTKPEDDLWNSLPVKATDKRMWNGAFQSPVAPVFADCFPSYFGTRRSYNGSEFNYFHTGLDFCTGSGSDIYAVAAGTVVYTGSLTVRGNATMIDHGWGVYTTYMHQSEILVKVGDHVEAGQLIGLSGGTGRVTGAHLHLEVWVGGVQVNPMDWLQRAYP